MKRVWSLLLLVLSYFLNRSALSKERLFDEARRSYRWLRNVAIVYSSDFVSIFSFFGGLLRLGRRSHWSLNSKRLKCISETILEGVHNQIRAVGLRYRV